MANRVDTIMLENGIPIPPLDRSAERKTIESMDVGASFIIRTPADRVRIRSILSRVKRTSPGKEFTLRKVGKNRWRAWRIK